MKTIMKMDIERLFLVSLLLISVDRSSAADFVIDWSVTFDATTFGLSAEHKAGRFGFPEIYVNDDNSRLLFKTSWAVGDDFASNVAAVFVLNPQGEILGWKRIANGASERPVWCRGGTMVSAKSTIDTPTVPVVSKLRPDSSAVEEPFPFGGQILGGNLRRISGIENPWIDGDPGAPSLFSVQVHGGGVTFRKIISNQDNVIQPQIKRSAGGVKMSTETESGKTYKVQSNDDLEQWKDAEVFQGDGSTKSVDRATDKPKEFLRVVEE